jgi:DNA-binding protein Fis
MFTKVVHFILGLCAITFSSQVQSKNESNCNLEIYIIGTIHSKHFDSEYHYSIPDIQAQICALKPDLVCGEITPEAFEQVMEGYFPPEAAFLAEMALKLNYRFEPVDWRLDYATQSKAEKKYPKSVMEKVSSFGKAYFANFEESDSTSVYDNIHSEMNIAIVDSVFEKIIGVNQIAETAHGNWNERNRRIVENGLATAKNARRIVFIFGSDHIPQIRRQLEVLGYKVQIPKRLFEPCNNFKVSDEVLTRWRHNLENLKLIRERKIQVTEDDYQKLINSRRIEDLELAIQKST